MDRRLYSVADLLAMFPRSRTQLYRDMQAGLLPYVQVGHRRYFEPEATEQYVEALKAERPAVERLVELVDPHGRIDVAEIPPGTTLADLAAVKQTVAKRREVDGAAA